MFYIYEKTVGEFRIYIVKTRDGGYTAGVTRKHSVSAFAPVYVRIDPGQTECRIYNGIGTAHDEGAWALAQTLM